MIRYHAQTGAFLVPADALHQASHALIEAIKHIRIQAGLPLSPYTLQGPMQAPQFAEASILEAARNLGIALGADRFGQLNLRTGEAVASPPGS